MSGKKWRTREGKVMLMSEMTLSHIFNALRRVDKPIEEYKDAPMSGWAMLHTMRGEYAQLAAEEAVDQIDHRLWQWRATKRALEEELERRKEAP